MLKIVMNTDKICKFKDNLSQYKGGHSMQVIILFTTNHILGERVEVSEPLYLLAEAACLLYLSTTIFLYSD